MKQRQILSDIWPDFRRDHQTQEEYLIRKKEVIVDYVKQYVEVSGARGVILGISGGVDSFLVGAIAAQAMRELSRELYLLILPYGLQDDYQDAEDSILRLRDIYPAAIADRVSIDTAYAGITADLATARGFSGDRYTLGNIQARLRMVYQYACAQGMLVAGTDHATEAVIGFYTKYGDGGTDFNPIQELIKDDIYTLAEQYGAPEAVLRKRPAAGLGISEDDESEMGISYRDICAYLRGYKIDKGAQEKLEAGYERSRHKRARPAAIRDTYNVTKPTTHIHVGCVTEERTVKRIADYMNAHPEDMVLYVSDTPTRMLGEWVKKTVNTPIAHYNCFIPGEGSASNPVFGKLACNVADNVMVSGKLGEVFLQILGQMEKDERQVTLLHSCLEK
jgi:NAD+ synthase